jgi:hypothetical protein
MTAADARALDDEVLEDGLRAALREGDRFEKCLGLPTSLMQD